MDILYKSKNLFNGIFSKNKKSKLQSRFGYKFFKSLKLGSLKKYNRLIINKNFLKSNFNSSKKIHYCIKKLNLKKNKIFFSYLNKKLFFILTNSLNYKIFYRVQEKNLWNKN